LPENVDIGKIDAPRGASVGRAIIGVLTHPSIYGILDLALSSVLVFVTLDYAREQITGPLFAFASFIILLTFILGIAQVLARINRRWGLALFGPPLGGPHSMRRTMVRLAMEGADSHELTFEAGLESRVLRMESLDRTLIEERAKTDPDLTAFVQFVDVRGKRTMREVIGRRNLEFGSMIGHFMGLGRVAAQGSTQTLVVLSILILWQVNGSLAHLTLVQVGLGVLFLSALLVVITLQLRLSVMVFSLSYLNDIAVTESDRALVESLDGLTTYPTVAITDRFYSVLRRYIVRLISPLVVVNVVTFWFLFLAASLLTLAWPGLASDWYGNLDEAAYAVAVAGAIYLGVYWGSLRVLESLRDFLQPIGVGVLTAACAVLGTYVLTGSFSRESAIASVITALPASFAAGIASGFWRGKHV
jgi:hypothetical protein